MSIIYIALNSFIRVIKHGVIYFALLYFWKPFGSFVVGSLSFAHEQCGGWWTAAILVIFYLVFELIQHWLCNGNKCPECGEVHALSNVSAKVIDRSNSYRKKVGNEYKSYEKVTYLVKKRCKFCSHEFETTKIHEECLDSDYGIAGTIGDALVKKIRKY